MATQRARVPGFSAPGAKPKELRPAGAGREGGSGEAEQALEGERRTQGRTPLADRAHARFPQMSPVFGEASLGRACVFGHCGQTVPRRQSALVLPLETYAVRSLQV